MRVFVFEFVTGGGGSAQGLAHAPSLAVEGDAMLKAVIADFVALGVDVVTLRSADLPPLGNAACEVQRITTRESLWTAVTQTAAGADWTLIIAPETDGTLAECCRRVLTAGGRLLGPGLETVQIAADKQATAEWLAARGVAVAEGGVWRGAAAELREFPVVMKPRTGAGSQGIALVKEPVDLAAYETAF